MKKMSKILLLASVLFLLTPIYLNLYANDSSGEILPAGGVQLRKTNGIVMEVESLYMKPDRTNYLQAIVEVNYIFNNITDKDIITEVFFPLPKTIVRRIDWTYNHDFNFKLYVNGKEKKYEGHKVGGQEEYVQYFYWKQAFPANKRVHIKHTYIASGYLNAGGLLAMLNPWTVDKVEMSEEYRQHENRNHARASGLFKYILTTANNWNNPIRSFNLLVEGFSSADAYFEGKLHTSPDRYYAKNIINFAPSSELFFVFNQQLIDKKEAEQKKDTDVKLYYILETTDLSDAPNGKKTGKMKDDEYVWIVESAQDWVKIAQHNKDSDVLGWTRKENLIDLTQPDRDAMEEFKNNIKFSDAKLYKTDGSVNIRNTPNGKKIGKIKDGEYVWVVESAQDWSKIVHNDLRGWTHKQNLIDIWTVDK